uniref:hypothetical protein n=1 Tax=Paenarthrobacter ureafaciens TaxID=37931 RepID=UPI003F4914E5
MIEPLPTIAGGQVKVPTDPGLGNSLDPDAVERYRVSDDYRVQTPRHRLTFHTGTAGNRTYGNMLKIREDYRRNRNTPVQPNVLSDDGTAEFDDVWMRAWKTRI